MTLSNDVRLITDEDLEGLPPPVARCLRRSNVVGRPMPQTVSLTQTGRIRAGRDKRWMRFTAEETFQLAKPELEWRARMEMGGMPLGRAVDTLRDGRGRMHVRLLGLVDVVDASGPEMDQGATMRWLNETMWFPQVWTTGLISWEAVDDTSAVASLAGDVAATGEFRFDEAGRIVDFVADRYRDVDGEFVMTPWSTPLSSHSVFNGLELPSEGSGVWALPDGDFEYIQLEVHSITHV